MCIMFLVLVKEEFKMKTFKEFTNIKNIKNVFKFGLKDKIIFNTKEEALEWLENVKKDLKLYFVDKDINNFLSNFKVEEYNDDYVIVKNQKILSRYNPN